MAMPKIPHVRAVHLPSTLFVFCGSDSRRERIMQVELKARCVESVDDTQRVVQSIKHKMKEGGWTLLLLGHAHASDL
jgi:hypothetical protein